MKTARNLFGFLFFAFIASSAFSQIKATTGLIIDDGTTEIKANAYKDNKEISKVIIPSSVTKIGKLAFQNCKNLTEIEIPSSVKTISDAAFQNCTNLTKVTLHEGLSNLSFRLFKNTAIKEITIPATVTEFGDEIFADCKDLIAIKVDKNSLAHAFFKDDPRLAFTSNPPVQATLPVEIGWKKNEFTTEWKDYSWEFPVDNFTKGSNTISFNFTSGGHKLCLKDVIITADGKTVLTDNEEKSAGNNPKTIIYKFNLDSAPKTLKLSAKAYTAGGTNSNGTIILNGVIIVPYGKTEIKGSAYLNSELRKITIPATVTKIGDRAFKGCANLTEIYIPATVTTFGSWIFSECPNLSKILVDKYSEAHAYFSGDERMVLTDTKPTRSKEEWIASSKSNIMDEGVLYIANGVTKVQDNLYKDNAKITEIRFSDTVEKIGTAAFKNNTGLKKIVFPKAFTAIADNAFNGCSNLEEVVFEDGIENLTLYGNAFNNCPKLNSVFLPKSIKEIKVDGILGNKDTRIFHCYLGSTAQKVINDKGYKIDFIGIDEQNIDNIDLSYLAVSGNTTIKAGLLKTLPFEKVDLNNNITEIGKNAFNDNTIIRVKRNTESDRCMRANGYYLCEVLADINFYTKDKSKQINEDFTRILCDDDPYLNWTSYKFKVQEPLKIEEVDGRIVLTSFLLKPCKNVTVQLNGKPLIRKKTIQPLTRTILCEAESSIDLEDFVIGSDDPLYNTLTSLALDWSVSFNGNYFRPTDSGNTGVPCLPMYPVYCREWLATICNHAYVIASDEYEALNYEYVEKKWLVTDDFLEKFMTKEEMSLLLEKTRNHTFLLGNCDGGGLGDLGGSGLWLLSGWFRNLGKSGGAFYHEFSHNMGYNHNDGNMCNDGAEEGYGKTSWPGVGSKVFQELFETGELPYTDLKLFNSDFFSSDQMNRPKPAKDVIKDKVLYLADNLMGIGAGEYSNYNRFKKIVFSSSVEIICSGAFRNAHIEELEIPSTIIKIGNNAFAENPLTKTIVIPDSVKEIGDAAFLTNRIPKIVVPESVKKLGERITEPGVIWVVKNGSTAYDYAVKNNYQFEIPDETLEQAAARILKEDAEPAQTDGWLKTDFEEYSVRRSWDFSDKLVGGGRYVIRFIRMKGQHNILLRDTLFMADGMPLQYFPTEFQNDYIINVPEGTKKLQMYALAYTKGLSDAYGIIECENR